MSFIDEVDIPEEEQPAQAAPSSIFDMLPNRKSEPEAARLVYALGSGLGNPTATGPTDPDSIVDGLMRETRAVLTGTAGDGPITTTIRAQAGKRDIAARKEAIVDNYHLTPEGSSLRQDLGYQYAVLDQMERQPDNDIAAVSSEIGLAIDRAFVDSGTFLDHRVFSAQFENLAVTEATGSITEAAQFFAKQADDVSVMDWGLVGNLGAMLLPVVSVIEAVNMGFIASDVLPEDQASWKDFLFAGSAKEKIAEAYQNMTPAERIEYNEKIRVATEKYNGFRMLGGPGNDLEKWGIYGEIQDNLEEMLANDTSVDWTKGLDNVASAVTYIPIAGGVAGTLIKGQKALIRGMRGAQYRGSYNLHIARRMEGGAKIVSEVINEGSQAALDALGTTREDALLAVLPKPLIAEDGVALRTLPDIAANDIAASTAYAKDAILQPLTRSAAGVDMSTDEVRAAFQATAVKQAGTHVNMSLSKIGDYDEASETFVLKTFMGVDPDNGFTKLDDAVQAWSRYQINDTAVVYKYDASIDGYRPMNDADWATAKGTDTGEFFLVYDQRMGMGKDYIASLESMRRKPASIAGLGNWLVSPLTRYGNDLRTVLNVAVSGEAKEIENFRRAAKPYHDLSQSDRAVVDTLLHSYDGVADLKIDDLLAPIAVDGPKGRDVRLLTPAQITGYVAYRNTMDASWARLNQAERTRMMSEGLRWVYDKTHKISVAARQLIAKDEALGEIGTGKVIFDPQTGLASRMDPQTVDAVYGSAGHLVKLEKPMLAKAEDGATHEVRYAVVRPGGSTSVTDLPEEVVTRTPGYTPRVWTAPWIITRPNMAKGEPDYIAMGHDHKEVNQWLEAYRAKHDEGSTDGWEVIANPVLVNEQLTRRAFEVENLMFYQDRTGNVTQIGAKDIRESPGASLNRMVGSVAQHVMTGRVLEKMEHQFVKEFGKYFEGGLAKIPTSRGDLRKMFKGNDKRILNEAYAMYDWLNVMHREKGLLQEWTTNVVAKGIGEYLAKVERKGQVSDFLAGKPVRAVGSFLMTSDIDPVKFARTTAFVSQILMNPVKQIIVNSPQLALFASKNPKNAARALGVDATYLSVMFHAEKQGIKANQGLILKSVLKTDDAVQTADMKSLAKAFKDSGLGEVQELHAATENTFDLIRTKAMRTLGEMGFAAGERFNLAAAFSFSARNLSDKLGKPLSEFGKKEWELVTSDARQYSGNMTRADAYSYQQGGFAAMMQYMAIRHKMVNMMTHGDQLTGGEKLGSMALMASLYGANGLGVAWTVTETLARVGLDYGTIAEELSGTAGVQTNGDEVKQAIEGGLVDIAHNALFDAALDGSESSNVELSSAVSPFAGLDKSAMGIAMLFRDRADVGPLLDFTAGPSGHVFGKMANIYNTASNLIEYDTKEINEERAASLAKQLLTLSSGGSNALRAYIGSATGHFMNGYLTPTAEATKYELLALGIAGLQSTEAREMYDFRELAGYDSKASPDALRNDINELTNHLVYQTQLADSDVELEDRMAAANMVFEGMKRAGQHSALFVDNVKREYYRKLGNINEPANKRVYEHILARAQSGVSGKAVDDPKEVLQRMLNLTYFQEHPDKAQILRDALATIEEQNK